MLLALLPLLFAPLAQTSVAPPQSGAVAPHSWEWTYHRVIVSNWHPQLQAELINLQGGRADLYLRFGGKPKHRNWDARSAKNGLRDEEILVNSATTPALETGIWWIGVWHETGTTFDLNTNTDPIPSAHAGMGANVFNGATSFRVWAPNAIGVKLAGDFNGWSSSVTPLASEGSGTWSIDIRHLLAGGKYQFIMDAGNADHWRNDPRARQVTSSTGDSVIVDPAGFDWSGDNFQAPSWNELVVYEMHLGTFNPSGMNIGNLNDAAQRLDYLADLGINAIELMPICEFSGDRSWGYNYGHPFAVESTYGTPDELRAFIKAAHQKGIAVMLDVLYNHWGPTEMDLWRFDGWGVGNYGGIYFYNNARAVTPWGDTRPNYGSDEVRKYIRDNVLFWFEEYHVDGLRWDATSYMRNDAWGDNGDAWSLMQWINDEINQSLGGKINIAEDMWSNEWLTKPTSSGGAGFDSQWDPNFVHPMRDAAIASSDQNRDMYSVRDAITFAYNGGPFERVIYTESHDEVANGKSRVPEEIYPGNADSWHSKKRSTLIAAALFTTAGIPQLFQGQEFLEDGFFDDNDPLDWGKYISFSGIHRLYKDLISLRKNNFANTAGLKGANTNVHHVNNSDKLIAYHRWDQGGAGDDTIILLNFSSNTKTSYSLGFPQSGTWHVRFNSDANVYDGGFGDIGSTTATAYSGWKDGMPYQGSVTIAPYSALILSQ